MGSTGLIGGEGPGASFGRDAARGGRDGGKRRLSSLDERFGPFEVLGSIDVKSFHAFGEEGDDGLAADRAPFQNNPGPRDLEAGVLDKNFGQELGRGAVPRLLDRPKGQERKQPSPPDDPHLSRVLRTALDRAKGVNTGLGKKRRPRPPDRRGQSKGARWAQNTE